MNESRANAIIAMTTFIIHFLLVVVPIVLFIFGGFDEDQLTSVLGIIFPMLSGHGALMYNSIRNQILFDNSNEQPSASLLYVVLSSIIPVACAMIMFTMMVMQASGVRFHDFESFKKILLILESIFGFYIGLVVGAPGRHLAESIKTKGF
jgi:hypothetical protein